MTVRNAAVGKRNANSSMKSHDPLATIGLMKPRQMSRITGAAASIAFGENHGFRIRRYLMWSGASTCVGTNR